jgi:hypothetical protein
MVTLADGLKLALDRAALLPAALFWAIGDAHADPYCIVVPERINILKLRPPRGSRRGEG